jgi:hypothetical protein
MTKVSVPFSPGRNLYMLGRKLWADDVNTRLVWYSSSINGPTDWVNSGDAGYLPVLQHATGDQSIEGFAQYSGKLVVMFRDSVQLWNVGPDPADHSLAEVIRGAGTEDIRSVVDMSGTLTYFNNGGFRTLTAVAVTGEKNDDDLGAKIYPETRTLDLTGKKIISVWSASRSQMLCAIGDVIYAYTNSSRMGINGWTKYELPSGFDVNAMVELDGQLYIRSNNDVYVFDSNYQGEPGFDWDAQFQFLHGQSWGRRKEWLFMETAMRGMASCRFFVNPNDESMVYNGPSFSGSIYGSNRIPLPIVANSIAPAFHGNGSWALDSLAITIRKGDV